jgi:hypothetical protein
VGVVHCDQHPPALARLGETEHERTEFLDDGDPRWVGQRRGQPSVEQGERRGEVFAGHPRSGCRARRYVGSQQLPRETKRETLLEFGRAGAEDEQAGVRRQVACGRDQSGLAQAGVGLDIEHRAGIGDPAD